MADDPNDVIEVEPSRGPRRWIGVAVLAALVVVPVVSLLSGREPGAPPVPTPGALSATVAAGTPANALYPEPRRRRGGEILDVVFPDGSKAEVTYPAELALAELGVRPARGGWLEGDPGLFRRLTAPPGGLAEVARSGPMIRRLAARSTLWQPMTPAEGQVLLFDFASWHLALHDLKDGMTFEQRLLWAEKLRGRVTRDGYLVLDAGAPVRLAGAGRVFRGELMGPQLWFGAAPRTLLVLAPAPHCDVGVIQVPVIQQDQRFSAETCRDGVYVAASGERARVERMISDIRVRLGD